MNFEYRNIYVNITMARELSGSHWLVRMLNRKFRLGRIQVLALVVVVLLVQNSVWIWSIVTHPHHSAPETPLIDSRSGLRPRNNLKIIDDNAYINRLGESSVDEKRKLPNLNAIKLPDLNLIPEDEKRLPLDLEVEQTPPPTPYVPTAKEHIYPSSDIEDEESRHLRKEADERRASLKIPGVLKKVKCDVPCFVQRQTPLVGGYEVRVADDDDGQAKFMHTMEGPRHYPKSKGKGPNSALSTTSFAGEIPLPYFSWNEYIINKANNKGKIMNGITFVARNCGSMNNREGLVDKLKEYIDVYSMSSCKNNAEWPSDIPRKDKVGMLRRYLFHAAFENECSDDYMTEKLWGSLDSGTLPVYYGAPNVNEHVPTDWIINVNAFASWDDLGRYLQYLTKNRTAYLEYHKWRSNPYPPKFLYRYNFTHTHSQCRKCRWAYAKRYNLGWRKDTQTIVWKENAPFEAAGYKPFTYDYTGILCFLYIL
uniref:Fucosyltransferase n=1 Tax=Aplanochytrium stocchinoi TaxID=215587 RepID=A0A7S3PE40_9STRA